MAEDFQEGFSEIRKIVSEYIHTSEFKRFISALDASMSASGQTTLSVMSQFQGEGKSFLTCAIAVSFVGFLGKRVLVVDTAREGDELNLLSSLIASFAVTDMPQGSLDVMTGRGLAGGMAGQTDFRLKSGIEHFGASYDRIIVDTVSIEESEAASIDPIVVAKQCGRGLLITSPLSLHINSSQELARHITRNRVPLLGTVYFGGIGA